MRVAVRTVIAFVAAAVLGACTIEHTRALGQQCLEDRECVTGLVCSEQTDGTYACVQPPEGGIPGNVDAVAPSDTSVDAPAQ